MLRRLFLKGCGDCRLGICVFLFIGRFFNRLSKKLARRRMLKFEFLSRSICIYYYYGGFRVCFEFFYELLFYVCLVNERKKISWVILIVVERVFGWFLVVGYGVLLRIMFMLIFDI